MSACHIQQELVRRHFPQSSEKDEMLEKVRGSTGQLGFPHWKENRPTSTLLLLQEQTAVMQASFIHRSLPVAVSERAL